jgi:Tfp pilus assembly protein PilZ
LSCAIAEKELLRSLTEIAAALAVADAVADAEVDVTGAELLLELLELLQPAATRSAAAAAAAVRPARADTEYNGVPRSFTQTRRERHVRDQIRITRS